jgi:NhaP-type Na+/H+ or K+/H+ antiporter
MSKYEKLSWFCGITTFLFFGVALALRAAGWSDFGMLFLLNLYCFIAAYLFRPLIVTFSYTDYCDRTEEEKRLSDKAAAWTLYGLLIISTITVISITSIRVGSISSISLTRETITITITRNTFAFIFLFVFIGSVSVQSFLLAVFLRRARKPKEEFDES